MAISEPVGGSFPSYAPVRRFANVLSPASGNCDFAYITDETGSFNLWRVDASSGEARQVTRFVDRSVNSAAYSPDGTLIAISCDHGGQESPEIVLLNREGETVHALASIPRVSRRLNIDAWSPDGRFLAYGSNERGDHSDTDILALDVRSGESQPLIEAAGWHVFGSWSPDGGRILAAKVESITNQKLCIARLGLPNLQVLRTFEGEASCEAGGWSADGAGVYYLSNAGREFRGLAWHDLASDVSRWVETPEWDIELFSMSRDGAVCAWTVNRDGVSELSMRRQSDGRRIALPSVPEGVILAMAFTRDAEWLGLLISTGTTPKDLYTIHLRSGCLVRLTRSVANIPSGTEPTRLRYRTHDGRLVPSLLYRPPTKPGVRLPVLISIHGGPAAQERPAYVYAGLYQYLLSRGIAIFAPNVRGSTGYGKEYEHLVHRDWGGGELSDLEWGRRYLDSQEWVDRSRIAIFGGSFGGFLVLSMITRLSHDWAAAVAIAPPTDLPAFVGKVPPHWRKYMDEWIGNDQPALVARSPLTHAAGVRVPLLIVQGRNDPRVSREDTDRFVSAARAAGAHVDYDVYDDEGHGFDNRMTDARVWQRVSAFIEVHLIRPTQWVDGP